MYGFLQGIRSSCKLARECEQNLEVIWLLEGLRPSNKTIADFRKDNLGALKGVNKDFGMVCQDLGLFGGELVTLDGSHFRGNVGKKSIYSEKRLKKSMEGLEKLIAGYLAELEKTDAVETYGEAVSTEVVRLLSKDSFLQKEMRGALWSYSQ